MTTHEPFALLIERRFTAPPARVFALWADADLRRQWWGPPGFVCTAFTHDFVPGGAWRAVMLKGDVARLEMAGVYREIAAPERIAFSFEWVRDDPSEPKVASDITVTLYPDGAGGTEMHFAQAPFDNEELRDRHVTGWQSFLDRMERTLAI